MTLYRWQPSQALNSTADPSINWAEGQAPSTVNDSARAMMAATAKYRDDVAGAIVTGGSSIAYTVTSNQQFASFTYLNGQIIAFTPHVTNSATVTLNVDGLNPRPLRTSPGVELQSGVLIQGTPYVAIYNNSDNAFYLRGVGPQPGIPLGASIDYWGASAPSTYFALAYGQGLNTTAYASLFALMNYTYGGSGTTFNLPDLRGRVVAGLDNMGGSAASRLTSQVSGGGTTLGGSGGEQLHQTVLGELPTLTATGTPTITSAPVGRLFVPGTNGAISGSDYNNGSGPLGANFPASAAGGTGDWASVSSFTATPSLSLGVSGTGGAGGGSATSHNNVQPTIIANKLIRII
jgi:microcystin-dependent protein